MPNAAPGSLRWEVFRPTRGRYATPTPRATLTPARLVWLNRSAAALLGDARAVTLHYEWATGRIGLRPAAPGSRNSYRFRVRQRGAYVTAMAFCRYFGVPKPLQPQPYTVAAEDGVLVLTPAAPSPAADA